VLGHAVLPYLQRVAENADRARDAAQAVAGVRPANRAPTAPDPLTPSPASPSS
jgi:hypothetical protein